MDGLTALLLVAMFFLVSYVHGGLKAYLDPNTGSMALQLVLAGVVGLLATLRAYRQRVGAFLRRRRGLPDAPEQDQQ